MRVWRRYAKSQGAYLHGDLGLHAIDVQAVESCVGGTALLEVGAGDELDADGARVLGDAAEQVGWCDMLALLLDKCKEQLLGEVDWDLVVSSKPLAGHSLR